jgi:predicted secreted protein
MRMIRLSLLLLLALAATAGAARAAIERPRLDVLGFSPDGRFFAYRQSGVMGSKGDAFADLFVHDTTRKAEVKNTPIRVLGSKDLSTLEAVRLSLESQSTQLLRKLGLSRAIAGVAFIPRERNQMWLDMPWGERVMLGLSHRGKLAAPGCPLGVKVPRGSLVGVSLTVQRGNDITVVHSDKAIPRMRGCPVSYRFASGFIKPRGSEVVVAAVLAYSEPDLRGNLRTRYTAISTVIPRLVNRR